ncbi:MAG TPA: alcohol dehydrogenase catalytic domain-containing protein, partial [Gemmatimonadaceae bacterium]|nr:alcohol dehydrogenase catalytic domain-containing protein [Gemmatimonadaceae bacterium]
MTAPASMRTVVITRSGGPEVLELQDRPVPAPTANEILVRVRATALNRADLLQREGRYPAPPGAPADIPGMEFAGEVIARGANVAEWQNGDRVFGIVSGGANAEYLVTDAACVVRVPDRLSWTDAASIPEAFITVHDALVTQAGVRANERVLIHAVGSGVGLAAVQMVTAWGAVPYGTARTAEKIERARELGLVDGV